MTLLQLAHTKRQIVAFIKRNGSATRNQLALALTLSGEAIRRHLGELKHEGWIQSQRIKTKEIQPGRPAVSYGLTAAGEHLFPKHYDDFSIALLETIQDSLGPETAKQLLAAFTEKRIAAFQERLKGLPMEEKLEQLKSLYFEGDPYVQIEKAGQNFRLIEYNCPFLNIAMKQPVICSSSVHFLARILGVRVTRQERFQNGQGRCVFHIQTQQTYKKERFELEPKDFAEVDTL